jgi:hypothetical protein
LRPSGDQADARHEKNQLLSAFRAGAGCAFDLSDLGRSDEWHLDLEKNVTMDTLGGYPACPPSSKNRDLGAIRRSDRSAPEIHGLPFDDTLTN